MSGPTDLLPAGQITALINGLDPIVDGFENALETGLYVESLPIIGTGLTSILHGPISTGQNALKAFNTLKTNIESALATVNALASATVGDLQTALNTAIGSAGFAGIISVGLDASNNLTVTLNDSASKSFTQSLDGKFGLPGLDFDTTSSGSASTSLNYKLDVTATVDSSGNFQLTAPAGNTALSLGLSVTPTFTGDASLGLLDFSAVDKGSSLTGTFKLDPAGNASFDGSAALNVHLASDMGSADLPSVGADLQGNWLISTTTFGSSSPTAFGGAPSIALNNVTYNFGDFVNKFITPILGQIQPILSPIHDAIAVFNTPLDFLGGGLAGDPSAKGDTGLLGSGWHALDVAGGVDGSGNDAPDGQITMLDLLKDASIAEGVNTNFAPIVQLINVVNQLDEWAAFLTSTKLGPAAYTLGSFTIPGDVRDAALDLTSVTPGFTSGQNLSSFLTSLSGSYNTVDTASGDTAGQILQSLIDGSTTSVSGPNFSFPIISNPTSAFQFLLGGTADLVDASLPQVNVNIGPITFLDLPIPLPPPIDLVLQLDLQAQASLQAAFGLDIGFDTTGLSEFKASGFTNPAAVLDGLFIKDPTINGVQAPVMSLTGDISLMAKAALGFVASVSGGGDLSGTLDLSLSQPKTYINKLASEIATNPFSIFDASGRITAGFNAVANLAGFSWPYHSPRITLANFDSKSAGANGIPAATIWVGGASGDFLTDTNWNPTFTAVSGTDFFGAATIGANSAVTFNGALPADLALLSLGANSSLDIAAGQFTIEAAAGDSSNSGTLAVDGTGNLVVQGAINNTGLIRIGGGTPTITLTDLLELTGGGQVTMSNSASNVWQGSGASPYLWNSDNTISGAGSIGVQLLNQGTVNATGTHFLVLGGATTNQNLLEATGSGAGLDIQASVDNTGGTILANDAEVLLDNGVTVTHGRLGTTGGGFVTTNGVATIDGGTSGLFVDGNIGAGSVSQLIVTGLITGQPFSTTLGKSAIASGNGTVLLQGATIQAGELDGRQLASGPAGTLAVSGTAILDASAGDGSIGLDGMLQVGAGQVLIVDGPIDPGLDGGGIELVAGTLIIGDAISDSVTLAPSLMSSTPGGLLQMDDAGLNIVTGNDAGSTLTNHWLIQGSGDLGGGELTLINAKSGVIAGSNSSALIVDTGATPILNDGLMEANGGTLDVRSNVINAAGTIGADGGVTVLDNIVVGGGTLMTNGGGIITSLNNTTLDGSASLLTIAAGANIGASAGTSLTLQGSIDNAGIVASTAGGIVTLHDDIANANGTLASLGGTVHLAAVTVHGGGLETDTGGILDVVGAATLDGQAEQVNLTLNSQLQVTAGNTLTLQGALDNQGTLSVTGSGYTSQIAQISVSGSVVLAGGGFVTLQDGSGIGSSASQVITGTKSGDTLVNFDNSIIDYGRIGVGDSKLTLINKGPGEINAAFGTLVVDTGSTAITNLGELGATAGGVLDLRSTVKNAGGTIGGFGGTAELDGITVRGGTLNSNAGGSVQVAGSAALDGVANTVTLDTGAVVVVGAGDTLSLSGTIDNNTTLSVQGSGYTSQTATLLAAGTATLTGKGTIALSDVSGVAAATSQVITGSFPGDTLDNIDNTISGIGEIGTGDANLTLINEANGTIVASGGTMIINTGTSVATNLGLAEAVAGSTLVLRGTIDSTGGTLKGDAATVELDDVIVRGGHLATANGGVVATNIAATLDGTKTLVILDSGAQVVVGAGDTLTLTGNISDQTTLNVQGSGYTNNPATLKVSGTAILSGKGTIALTDVSGIDASSSQILTGVAATDTLDNFDDTISGYGELGAGAMTLVNESLGIVDATGGLLVLDTTKGSASNAGTLEAISGTLQLASALTNTGTVITGASDGIVVIDGTVSNSGLVQAANGGTVIVHGAVTGKTSTTDITAGSTLLIDGGLLQGGTLSNETKGVADVTTKGGMLASIAVVNASSLNVIGDGYNGKTAELDISGTVALTGGGTVALFDGTTNTSITTQVVTAATGGGTLDNINETISGYGSIGAGNASLTLINEAAGTIEAANSDTLVVDTGSNTIVNKGLLNGIGGSSLVLRGNIANTGGTIGTSFDPGHSTNSAVFLDHATVNGGTLAGVGGFWIQVANSSATLDGTADPVTVVASGTGLNTDVIASPNGTLTLKGAIVNQSIIEAIGSGTAGNATLEVAGKVTLTGGGSFGMGIADATGSASTQVITGTKASDTLDNVDNVIGSIGQLGAGRMTLINETKGTVLAGQLMVLDTGSTAVTNLGHLGAGPGGLLDLRSDVNNAGGTITAIDGTIDLDGMTVHGGLLRTEIVSSMIQPTGKATLDGNASAVTLATGSLLQVSGGNTLALTGTIDNLTTLNVSGSGYTGQTATLLTTGTATLTGGGTIALADVSGVGSPATQVITGTTAGDTLDNTDNTISGYGQLGTGDNKLTLINETHGTIDAIGRTLTVNTGTNVATNLGLAEATTTGVLDLQGTIANNGGKLLGDGATVELDGVIVRGGDIATANGGLVTVAGGNATLDGSLHAVTLDAKSQIVVGGGETLTLEGTIVNNTTLNISGSGYTGQAAVLKTSGTTTLTGKGTIALADVSGTGQSTSQVITDPVASDTLDNVDNTISGYGEIGAGTMVLINEAHGTIDASGGTLIIDTGSNVVTNLGLAEATPTGVLDLHGTIDNTGGTISASGATVQLDGVFVRGGDLATSSGGVITTTVAATLDGITHTVTLDTGAQVVVGGNDVLQLKGSIVNHGTIAIDGSGYTGQVATLAIAGTVALSGGGLIALSDISGIGATTSQLITGTASSDTLDNIDNKISGFGELGAGQMTLVNQAGGTIDATGGTLVVDTATAPVVNDGLMAAVDGTLLLRGLINDTGGGTLGALHTAGAGIILLDGATVRGGTVLTDATNQSTHLAVTDKGGTLDSVTLLAGDQVVVDAAHTLTLAGTITNRGTVSVQGYGYTSQVATLLMSGGVVLTGGGVVALSDVSGVGAFTSQLIAGTAAGSSLDNRDNTITGFGELGVGDTTLGLTNELNGTIEATGGTLAVNIGPATVVNDGLMEAATGTLTLRSTVDDTGGGILSAVSSGVILLDGTTVRGGTIETTGAGALFEVTANGGTLDGVAGAITIGTGARIVVNPADTLAIQGAIANGGTISVLGYDYTSQVATLLLSNNVSLTGGGVVSLVDVSGIGGFTSQVITGAAASDTLDNVDNTITGAGLLGAGKLTLANQTGGTIDATTTTLEIDTGTNSITNKGLLEAIGGTLQIDSAVANSGTIKAAAGGNAIIDASVTNTGLLSAESAGTVKVRAAVSGSGSATKVANGGTLVLDGGTLNGGTLNNAATGIVDVTTNDGQLTDIAVTNAGSIAVLGYGYTSQNATLSVAGTVSLSGGGTVSLVDTSGISAVTSQVITGTAATDKLDNVDNTIVGIGELGNGLLTLVNESKGIVDAAGGALIVDTGSTVITNHGMLEATTSGTLDLHGTIANAAATISGADGIVELDSATVRGGTIATSGAGTIEILGATTLDGTTTPITLDPGVVINIANGDTLTLAGKIANEGSLNLLGYGYSGLIATLQLAGTVTLTGGGLVSLTDVSGVGSPNSQVITGTVAGDALDNSDNTIRGSGLLGHSLLTLTNESAGIVHATGGTLVVDTGSNTVVNKGRFAADNGTLEIDSATTNSGTIEAGTAAGVVIAGAVASSGLLAADNGGTVTVRAAVTGATSATKIASGGTLVLDGGALNGGSLSNAATGSIVVTTNDGQIKDLAVSNAGAMSILGYGYSNQDAMLTLAGTVTLSGGGTVSLTDTSGVGAPTSQIITGTASTDTLDNVDNAISGIGELGAGQMTLANAAKATINATGGTLTIDTGANAVANQGLLEATNGTLQINSAVTNSGTIEGGANGNVIIAGDVANTGLVVADSTGRVTARAAITGATSTTKVSAGGTLMLDGGALSGGSLNNAATGIVDVTANGGALTNVAFSNAGAVDVLGNGYSSQNATLRIAGTVTLSGGGSVSLIDQSGIGSPTSQIITGTASTDTLDNVDNTISGIGELGAGQMTLVNAAKATIDATGGTLTIDTAANVVSNQGVLEATNGTLQIDSALTNSGTIEGGANGNVIIAGAVANTGLVVADSTGTVTVRAAITGASGTTKVAAGGTLVLDGGALNGGSLSNAAGGIIDVTTNGGGLTSIAVTNAGALNIDGIGYSGQPATLSLSGTVALSGGGTVSLIDTSGISSPVTQVITGTTATDTLDNIDNTISGIGVLGAGQMTLVNAAKGTVDARFGRLTLDTGASTIINQGELGANNGTLAVNSAVANSGTIRSEAGGNIILAAAIANTGLILADTGGAVTVSSTITGATGTTDVASNGILVLDGAALNGGSLSAATKGIVDVTTNGALFTGLAVANAGTVNIFGDGYLGQVAALRIAGKATISGGGTISLIDNTGFGSVDTQVITGTTATDTLDNGDNTINGSGLLGAGKLTLNNGSKGIVDGTGVLVVDTGSNTVNNQGLLEAALNGTLDLLSNISNAGGTIAANGGLVVLDNITVSGGELGGFAPGTIQALGSVGLDGTAHTVTLASGALLSVDSTGSLGLGGSIIDNGTLANAGSLANSDTLTVGGTLANEGTLTNDGTIINNGTLSNDGSLINDGTLINTAALLDSGSLTNNDTLSGSATLTGTGTLINNAGGTVTGSITATAAGETVSNLGVVLGPVALAGNDRLVESSASQFKGGITGGKGGNILEITGASFALTNFNAVGTPQFSALVIDAGTDVTTDLSDTLTGIALVNFGTLNLLNFETANGMKNAGAISGDVTLTSSVPLINTSSGTISGYGLAVIEGTGGPAAVLNAGVIDPATFGVYLHSGGTVTNVAGGLIDGTVAGVKVIGGSGTVMNAGTINGGGTDAVTLASGFTNRVILDPGATFTGIVDGGNSVGGKFASTLELAAGAGSITLGGLGTEFVNFSTVLVDSGASVHLTGVNTAAAGVTLTDQGMLTLDGGATLFQAQQGVVSGATGSSAQMVVDGAGSSWTDAGGAVIGDRASGSLLVNDKASVTVGTASSGSPALLLGAGAGGEGALEVSAATLAASGALTIGQSGAGHLLVDNQGTLNTGGSTADNTQGIEIGQNAGSSGDATVAGNTSLLSNTGRFVVGDAGLGSLVISSGGTVITTHGAATSLPGAVIAASAGSDGAQVSVTGTGSEWQITGSLLVGLAAFGSLAITAGGVVTADSADVGDAASGSGIVSVVGNASAMMLTGSLIVGDGTSAELSILSGGMVSANDADIGVQAGSTGNVDIEGAGSHLDIANDLLIGDAGVGVLTLGNGTELTVGNNLVVGANGVLNQFGGSIDPSTITIVSGGRQGGHGTSTASVVISNAGTLFASGGTETVISPLITAPSGKSGVLEVDAGGDMLLNVTSVDATQSVTFTDGTGILTIGTIGGFAASIVTVNAGDQIIVQGKSIASDSFNSSTHTLTLFDGSSATIGTLQLGPSVDGSAILANGTGGLGVAPCFMAGTRISTERGEVAVEDLRVGDRVQIVGTAASQPVIWIGHRTVDCTGHPEPHKVHPVRITAGAFGPGRPCRDLYLSLDHALFINDVLIPVKYLINGTSIRQLPRDEVTYYHVELPGHSILLADNLPAESYLDTGDRSNFANSNGPIALYPDFASRVWEAEGCAPLVVTGPELDAARQWVNALAGVTAASVADKAREVQLPERAAA